MPRIRLIPLLLVCASFLPAKSYVAERYDVRVQILPNTVLRVSENVRFRFEGGPFSFVSRELRKTGTDRIFEISALMDGESVRTDVQDRGQIIKVLWHFDAPQDSSREFTLTYSVAGAIRKEPDRDVLLWRAIPDRHDYTILAGQIEVEYPEGAALDGRPEVPNPEAARHERTRSVFALSRLERDRGVPVRVAFQSGFVARAPYWQVAESDRRQHVGTAWAAGGLAALIVAAIGFVGLAGFKRSIASNESIPDGGTESLDAVSSVPPAVAVRLAGGAADVRAQLGTLFDLARRGIVSIRQRERRRFGGRSYEIVPCNLRQPMLPFESALLILAFGDDPAPAPREFSGFVSKLSTAGGRLNKLVEQHVVSLGLLDPDRIRLQRRGQVGSLLATLAGLLAGIVGFAVSAAALRSGPAEAMPVFAVLAGLGIGTFLAGIAGLILSANISALTHLGATRAAPCRALRRHLLAVARQDSVVASPEEFERWLPFAVAFGSGAAWVKRFRKHGAAALPVWFAVDESELDSFALFDFVASSSAAADASASGGADGGGSGGGSSSAG